MRHLYSLLTLLILSVSLSLQAQAPERLTSGELHAAIQKLGVLGSALYVAAHPDDENTRMIAYLANVEQVETGYLSMTRGDGGQNLIAPDISELLGLTRTQELLAARRIDGGKQFFTRANDFGYSKHPDETFTIWDKQQVLEDAVWVIRQQRPDIMILRFDPRAPGSTHGHHTASAIIGMEAFDLAGDPEAFPEQLTDVAVWQPKRLYWNAYSWGNSKLPDYVDTNDVITVEINRYLPKLGESVAEIAARSRSQHKSQGFGSAGSRAATVEKLELLKGGSNGVDGDPFAGIATDWSRLAGGTEIGILVDSLVADFDFDDPAASVPLLNTLSRRLQKMPDFPEKWPKIREVRRIMAAAMGLYISATTDTPFVVPGDTARVIVEVSNRSQDTLELGRIDLTSQDWVSAPGSYARRPLLPGVPHFDTLYHVARSSETQSSPYWLRSDWTLGMYTVPNWRQRGQAEGRDYLGVEVSVSGDDGAYVSVDVPVRHHYTDPVDGEQFQPFGLLPPVFVQCTESSYLFTEDDARTVTVKVTSATEEREGSLRLNVPTGWSVTPEQQDITLGKRGQERFYTFTLRPPSGQGQGRITPELTLQGMEGVYDRRLVVIDHPHIPTQRAALPGGAAVARVDLQTAGRTVGYLPGAGDAIPEALSSIGLDVSLLDDVEASIGDLGKYDAIVVGVRAYNTLDRMPVYQPRLLEYVKQGGTLIVQYNTNRRLKIDEKNLGPYALELSRDRVTVEDAPVSILAPDHPALNYPNKITAADFDGWVQERGLYFPDKWAPEYTALLGSNDPGEESHDGGLLVAEYGSGHFVYTGYSFFRELPAGVPGAYRLFANLIALGASR
ncbi:Mycothiol S-conjugate amidase [Neolewinella maritima]|uniref:Mycothiol S-conjugate amidase n=1 Tax=Neolewinella maritima TaxID=1383882 RepID=A0ABN8F3C3_9BACT|nr:PIG-L family deacetylase [Neolewinella maritima]CAH1001471.1 Mycothiol S-conjugate amidase [Neolewinella maritima]